MPSEAFSSTRKARDHGAVSGEGIEPESAPGRVDPAWPSRRSGCEASGCNAPVQPSKPERRQRGRTQSYSANDAIRLALLSAGKLETGTMLTAYQPLDRSEA
jgi:hypothetical protein